MKKRILIISNSDWFFLSHRLDIGLEAISKGYEVHIATKFTDKKEILSNYGFTTHILDMHRSRITLIELIKNFFDILNIIKEVKPNLIHAITIKPVIIGGIASRYFNNIPFIAAISGLGYLFTSNNFISIVLRNFVKLFYKASLSGKLKKVIFQNSSDQEIVKKFCSLKKDDFLLIPGSGVDLDTYKPIKNKKSKKQILFASRLLRSKGLLQFVESAENLKNIKYKFLIAGKFDLENPDGISKKEIYNWEKKQIIKYLGDIKDIRNLIQESDIVVLPSYYGEGLPKILIEAAACGVPVITTDHPGCKDAIIKNKTGLLVPIKDSRAISMAILKLINNKKLMESMGNSGRKFAERTFGIKKVVNIHMEIYKELIDKAIKQKKIAKNRKNRRR